MQLKTKYGLFTVHFWHYRQNEFPRFTKCEVHRGECATQDSGDFVQGKFKLYSKKSFNKRIARKISLANALRSVRREVRREIWKKYFEQLPNDKHPR